MIDPLMPQIKYINPPAYKHHSKYRDYLRKAANYSCAYCTISESESPGATFNIEHFRPQTYFKNLSAKCDNLRYTCPRCNSYKSSLWISEEEGCNRKCESCINAVCKNNIERFIDQTCEDPSKMIYLGEDDNLYAYDGSKPANYTIRYLRLNRAQLVKLRHVRRFMDCWYLELKSKREKAVEYLKTMEKKLNDFVASKEAPLNEKSRIYQETIETMYSILILEAEQSVLLIDGEMYKLKYLIEQRAGCDSFTLGSQDE